MNLLNYHTYSCRFMPTFHYMIVAPVHTCSLWSSNQCLRLGSTAGRVPRAIDCSLYMSCNATLARIKLASDYSLAAERSSDLLADLSNSAVWVKLLSDSSSAGNDGGILQWMLERRVRDGTKCAPLAGWRSWTPCRPSCRLRW